MSLVSRIQVIEEAKRLSAPASDRAAEALRLAAEEAMGTNWQIMGSTMSEEHLAFLSDVHDVLNRDGEEAAALHPGFVFTHCLSSASVAGALTPQQPARPPDPASGGPCYAACPRRELVNRGRGS